MNSDFIEQLLYEEEGPTLDFKRDQYAFAKATEEEKSELLKNILGFVNCWRRSEAFILIGVEEVQGGKSTVHGIFDHLADHSLQQFVNNLTNRPVQFGYEACECDGKQIGVIRIEVQGRPVFLKRDYGKLKKGEVYVRRGSSTDPSKPADPDEIARMGLTASQEEAELDVQFVELQQDRSLGVLLSLESENCKMPSSESFPDYRSRGQRASSFASLTTHSFDRPNEDYLRQMADFEFHRRLMQPLRIGVCNTGKIAAQSVRIEIAIAESSETTVFSESEMPDRPEKRHWNALMSGIGPREPHRSYPGETVVVKRGEATMVIIECGDLQPGRRVRSDVFFVGRADTGIISLDGKIFAANLQKPKGISLTVSMNVTHSSMSVKDLGELPDALESIDPALIDSYRSKAPRRGGR